MTVTAVSTEDVVPSVAAERPRPPAPGWRSPSPRAGAALAAVLGALAGSVLFYAAHRGLPDDAYISMSYARTLVETGHWGLTPFRDANAATSPLNVWLLAAGIVVTGRPVVAVGLVLMASTAAIAVWSSSLAALFGLRRWVLPTVLLGLLLTSPFFTSTVGMEAFLGAALVLGVLRYAAAGRAGIAGVLTGFAALGRPDLVVPAVVVLAVLFGARRAWGPLAKAIGIGVVVALPWHVFAWFALGGFLPDTFAIKTAGGAFADGETFANAPPRMLARWPVPITLVGLTMLIGLVVFAVAVVACVRGSRAPGDRVVVAAGGAAVVHWAAYALIGVPSYYWYFCPAIAMLAVCTAVGVARLAERGWSAALATVAVLVGVTAGVQLTAGVPWSQPVFYANWATAAEYVAIGQEVGRMVPPGQSVAAPGEIGGLAFGCRCDIVDAFSDHAWALTLAKAREEKAGPVMRTVLQANRAHIDPGPARQTDHVLHWEPGTGEGWTVLVAGRVPGHIWMWP